MIPVSSQSPSQVEYKEDKMNKETNNSLAKLREQQKAIKEQLKTFNNKWKEFKTLFDESEYVDWKVNDFTKKVESVVGDIVKVPSFKKLEGDDLEFAVDNFYEEVANAINPRKKAFGEPVSFKGDSTTLEQVFGENPISPPLMQQLLWKYIKSKQGEK